MVYERFMGMKHGAEKLMNKSHMMKDKAVDDAKDFLEDEGEIADGKSIKEKTETTVKNVT